MDVFQWLTPEQCLAIWAGVTKHRWFVLLFRMLGWAAVYFIPVQYVSVGNLRGFCLYGAEPGNSSLICWRVALGPQVISEYTEEKELQPRREMVVRG